MKFHRLAIFQRLTFVFFTSLFNKLNTILRIYGEGAIKKIDDLNVELRSKISCLCLVSHLKVNPTSAAI